MQSQGSSSSSTGDTSAAGSAREEDSGLHDIRSLASSQRLRNSSRRISTSPPHDDDLLASSSAGWKAVALPLTETDRRTPVPAGALAEPALGSADSHVPISTHVAKRKTSKAPLFATIGLGLAAAAGVVFYVANKEQHAADQTAFSTSANGSTGVAPGATVTPLPDPAPSPPATAPVIASAEEAAKPAPAAAANEPDRDEKPDKSRSKGKKARVERDAIAKTETAKPEARPGLGSGAAVVKTLTPKDSKDGEPSFEDLLKEANIQDKQDAAPKLEKKSLSGADITKGMRGVQPRAQGCYNGTQGTAAVKLTVEPSGKVQRVVVTGAFAGTPVAACVEKAVKSATFPAWDGAPQSFGYSYLLSE